jgi:hypothetical protein|tara:strand:- start:139 stop:423 length:285 start_codon:yes stop_codon:yes gene_type:complete
MKKQLKIRKMTEKQKHIRNTIKNILRELSDIMVDTQIELDQIPTENTDMEPYEGTPVEDLSNSSYIVGKMEMLEEMKDILELELMEKTIEGIKI